MTNQSFDDFVNQQSKAPKKSEVDWAAKLEDWKSHLSAFHQKVETFLNSYLKSGKLTLTKRTIRLDEEYIGSYEVDALDIILGGTKITLTPIGTNLIGAKGRVDMKGPKGTVRFVLVPKNSSAPEIKISILVRMQGEEAPAREEIKPVTDWEWKISTPPPRINYIELEEESFQTALMEVVNG